jgi:hypothetical protein
MNSDPISPGIKNSKNNAKELLNQFGEKLNPEIEIRSYKTLQEKGFGRRKKF